MPFDPVHFILFISAGLGFYAFQTKGRRRMLSFKVSADSLYGIYILLLGGYTGAMGAGIAALGGVIQVVTPARLMRKTLPYRFILACLLCVIGAYFFTRTPTDIYPFLGVVISRFVELFRSTLILRLGFLTASIPWLIYSYSNEFYLAMGFGLLMMGAIALGIFRNERRLPKDPVP